MLAICGLSAHLGRMNSPDTITRLNAALQGRYRIEREIGEGGMATAPVLQGGVPMDRFPVPMPRLLRLVSRQSEPGTDPVQVI